MKRGIAKRAVCAGLIAVALGYAYALAKVVLLKSGGATGLGGISLTPFRFVRDLFGAEASIDVALKNALGNFAIFIPMGLLIPALVRRAGFWASTAVCLLASLAIETAQYVLGIGMADVDDLLLNALGGAAGAALYRGLFVRAKTVVRARVLALAFLLAFGALGALSLWLYQPNLLPAQYAAENEAALGGVDAGSYDVTAVLAGVEDGRLALREGSASVREGLEPLDEYALARDAKIVLARVSHRYSPNGNIQMTTTRYEETSLGDSALAGGTFVDLWLDASGACVLAVVTVYEEEGT